MASVPRTSDAALPLRCGGVYSGICGCNKAAPLNLWGAEMTYAPLDTRFPSTQMGYVHTAVAYTVCSNVYYRISGTAATLAASAERLSDE